MSIEKTPSERHQLANRIAQFIIDSKLNSVHGGDVGMYRTPRPHYSVTFSYPRYLDGVVDVYSSKFISIRYQTSYRSLPHNDSRVFESEECALKFLRLAFIELKFDEALEIPVKEKK